MYKKLIIAMFLFINTCSMAMDRQVQSSQCNVQSNSKKRSRTNAYDKNELNTSNHRINKYLKKRRQEEDTILLSHEKANQLANTIKEESAAYLSPHICLNNIPDNDWNTFNINAEKNSQKYIALKRNIQLHEKKLHYYDQKIMSSHLEQEWALEKNIDNAFNQNYYQTSNNILQNPHVNMHEIQKKLKKVSPITLNSIGLPTLTSPDEVRDKEIDLKIDHILLFNLNNISSCHHDYLNFYERSGMISKKNMFPHGYYVAQIKNNNNSEKMSTIFPSTMPPVAVTNLIIESLLDPQKIVKDSLKNEFDHDCKRINNRTIELIGQDKNKSVRIKNILEIDKSNQSKMSIITSFPLLEKE